MSNSISTALLTYEQINSSHLSKFAGIIDTDKQYRDVKFSFAYIMFFTRIITSEAKYSHNVLLCNKEKSQ